jgi:hypothetical protein
MKVMHCTDAVLGRFEASIQHVTATVTNINFPLFAHVD